MAGAEDSAHNGFAAAAMFTCRNTCTSLYVCSAPSKIDTDAKRLTKQLQTRLCFRTGGGMRTFFRLHDLWPYVAVAFCVVERGKNVANSGVLGMNTCDSASGCRNIKHSCAVCVIKRQKRETVQCCGHVARARVVAQLSNILFAVNGSFLGPIRITWS